MWFLDGSWQMHDGMGWWMLWGGLMMALFWAAVIGAVVWLVARFGGVGRDERDESALEIARRRYARGDLSRDEFEQLRRDLG